jgi:uncharacterized protein (TIGR02646 family)
MIRVCKAREPEWFSDWIKQKDQGHSWKMREDQDHPPLPKNAVKNSRVLEALIDEQGGLCCYCGKGIDTKGSHIEHFRPQSKYPDLATEYENIHASCESRSKSNCGHAKDNSFDESKCISPLDVDEGRFLYTLEGEIRPKDEGDARATYMIGLLKLDSPALREMRKELLTRVLPPELRLSQDEIKKLRAVYQERDGNDRLQEFRQVLTCYIDNI